MSSPSERLEFLESELASPTPLPVHLSVQHHEEAIRIAIYSGDHAKADRLIDSYMSFFEPPVPYEIEYFCDYKTATKLWRESRMDEAAALYGRCRELAEKYGDGRSASRCLMAAGVIAWNGRSFNEALSLLEQAEKGLRSVRDETLSNCLNWLGIVCGELNLFPRSWRYYTEALEMNEELGLEASQGYLLSNLGLLCRNMGLVDQAEDSFRRSIQLHEKTGNKYGIIDSRANLGMLILDRRNRPEEALPMLVQAAEEQLEAGIPDKAGLVFSNAAVAAFRCGDVQGALEHFERAEELLTESNAWNFLTEMCQKKAAVLIELSRYDQAAELIARGSAIHAEHTGGPPDPESLELESLIATHLGDHEKACRLLKESCSAVNRIEAARAEALQDVIRMISEAAARNRELQEARHRAALLEERNAALAASERRFRQIVDRMAGIGVLAVDEKGRITFWNSSCERLYGYTSLEALGRRPDELIVPESSVELFNSVLSSNISGVNTEITLKTSDGLIKHMQVSTIPLLTGETFLAQVDLTCQREAEKQRTNIESQMRRTQKLEALGTLAGGIAHDFNNLLQGILANSCILCDVTSEDLRIHHHAELIRRAAERSSELCTQMLDYAGVKPVGHQILDLNDLVFDMTILLNTSLPKNVALEFDPSRNIPMVSGDRSQLRQIVMNLALNGAEAIQGSGRVTISTSEAVMGRDDFSGNLLEESPPPGRYIRLSISDNGAGIESGTLTRIFDPFFSTKKTGRGLGLAAVLGIIRAHQGAITVESAPGKGTEFNVFLRAAAVQMDQGMAEDPVEMADLGGKSILVVDDEQVVRETVEAILSNAGCRAVSVNGGAEALEYLDGNGGTTDMVILDLTMPGMDGVDVFRIMQERDYGIPVLLVSGYTRKKLESIFGASVPAGFLQKPFTPSELTRSMNGLLRGSATGKPVT